MSFFAGYDLNEEATDNDVDMGYAAGGNVDLNGTNSGKDGDKTQGLCRNEDGVQSNVVGEDGSGINCTEGRSDGVAQWGSNSWKDSQPAWNSNEKGLDLENDNKAMELSDGNSSEGYMEQKNEGGVQRGQADVPEDEMLSDEYYEQDGDDQSDSLHATRPSTSGLRFGPPAPKRNATRGPKALKYDDYNYDEDYEDDDDEDEDDEDDPDDADFDPDYGDMTSGSKKKGKLSDIDDSDNEVDDEDDDFDISDESDVNFKDNHRRNVRHSVQRKRNLVRESRQNSSHNRRKKTVGFSDEDDDEDDDDDDEEEDSAEDSFQESDDEFVSRSRRSQSSKKRAGRSGATVNNSEQNNEIRTSSRTTKKVSYVESEESEEIEEDKTSKQKNSLDELEEEDGDSIERVLWHQSKGMSEDALRNNKSTEPVVWSAFSNSDIDWNEMEFYIKWKGHSYLHCEWKPFSELQNLTGFKKVLNYMKRVTDERKFARALSREEVEVHDVGKEMELDLLKQYSKVERIFADRIGKSACDDEVVIEYLVKWQGLSYAEATWYVKNCFACNCSKHLIWTFKLSKLNPDPLL